MACAALVLVSRRGPAAPGVDSLRADLVRLGAEADIVACDLANRAAVAELLVGRTLGAVVHLAAVVDNGVIAAMTPERIDTVMRPKADAAWYLHELTRDMALTAFVMFSSAGGLVLAGGQGNYAAANVFLDALATQRRSAGLPAVSMAFGLWAVETGLSQTLSDGDRRMAAQGLPALSEEAGLTLFDAALRSGAAVAVPLRVDPVALRRRGNAVPALLREFAPVPAYVSDRSAAVPTFRKRLLEANARARSRLLLDMVCSRVAAVLGHASLDAIYPDSKFRDLGFDSLYAVELRNQLNTITGLRLSPTLVFDHPTPSAVAEHVKGMLPKAREDTTPPPGDSPDRTLSAIYRELAKLGRIEELQMLASGAAVLRPVFDTSADFDSTVRTTRLANGDDLPAIICFPSLLPVEGVLQYASQFAQRADLWVVEPPGYRHGEPLPASTGALLDVLVDATLRCADNQQFVLLGISSGGALAHAVATRLEAIGEPVHGMILLDTYVPGTLSPRLAKSVFRQMVRRRQETLFDDTAITASGCYGQMFKDWYPESTAVPTLVVRPREGVHDPAGPLVEDDWRTRWPLGHCLVTVPGDHFTMNIQHARTTAEAVSDWLSGVNKTECLQLTPPALTLVEKGSISR